nr:hypothetical protein [Tanacetum cinerariifolium]
KQYQPEEIQELMRKLLEDARNIKEELSEYINSPNWNFSMINDDEEHYVQYKEYLENSSNAIAPILLTEEPEYSLSMGYEHPSTTLETESDEVIKSSAKNLVPILKFSGELVHINPFLPGINDDSISLPKNKSSNFDHQDDPSFSRPPPKPPDVEFCFDFEPNSGEVISAVMNNIDELNEDECFDP